MEIRGKADEAIRDVCDVVISVHVDDKEEPGSTNPPSVGAIIGLRPLIQAVVGLNGANFDRLWTMAMAGQVRYAWIALTEPHRRSALLVNVSFSSEFEE